MLSHYCLYDGKEKESKEKEEDIIFSFRGTTFCLFRGEKSPLTGGFFLFQKGAIIDSNYEADFIRQKP